VENSLNFIQHGSGKNKRMPAIQELQQECSRGSCCPLIGTHQDPRVQRHPHRGGR
jgi:hypothetical protein